MGKALLLILTTLFAVGVFAQSAVVPAGGTATGSGDTVTYTVGQPADRLVEGSSRYVIEGVQQPYEIQTVGINNYTGITLEAVLYPNPTQHFVQLRISSFEIPDDGLTAQLFDANGKLLQFFTINDMQTKLDMEKYPSATYQLRVYSQERLLKTFKIVKNRF